jgi:hypothetical protein
MTRHVSVVWFFCGHVRSTKRKPKHRDQLLGPEDPLAPNTLRGNLYQPVAFDALHHMHSKEIGDRTITFASFLRGLLCGFV